MKTNKLLPLAWSNAQEADSHSRQDINLNAQYLTDSGRQATRNKSCASNDADYNIKASHMLLDYEVSSNKGEFTDKWPDLAVDNTTAASVEKGYKKATSTPTYSKAKQFEAKQSKNNHLTDYQPDLSKLNDATMPSPSTTKGESVNKGDEVLERVFMNGLIKHTGIALAIIIPLAAFSAYAAPFVSASPTNNTKTIDKMSTATLAVEPSSIIHKSASEPTTVDSVDLKKYAGTWYEIGRLPMYFQRNCASNVTATYTEKTDGSGITVLNQCTESDGTAITAEGLAKPADATGSKLKVSFLPSWIRWLPVGRADYWVLARDSNYQTALVGTPDREYLWLLARSPNIAQETYAKYRKIAQNQGYNLKEFKLTNQSNQTVNLVP